MPRWQNCITSTIDVAMTARWKVVLSPTLTGMVGNSGATPPASNMMTRLGACVRCASIAAAHGKPVPTATVLPSSSSRAAQQIISSIDVNGMGSSAWLFALHLAQTSSRDTPILSRSDPPRNTVRNAL